MLYVDLRGKESEMKTYPTLDAARESLTTDNVETAHKVRAIMEIEHATDGRCYDARESGVTPSTMMPTPASRRLAAPPSRRLGARGPPASAARQRQEMVR